MMTKFKVMSSLCVITLFVVSCGSLTANLHAREMRTAYETIDSTIREAERTGDTSNLPKVLTENLLPDVISQIDTESSQVPISGPAEIERIWVSEYNPPEAIVVVRFSFDKNYVYNRETNELTYENLPKRITQAVKIRMYQEDGVWKLDKVLEFFNRP